jgi:hypothetical protein
MKEQKDLLDLCKLCKSGEKKIFVVHNLLHVTTEEEFKSHIEEVSSLLTAKIHPDADSAPCDFAVEHFTPEGSTHTIHTIHGYMDGVEQVHFFLAKDPSVSEGSIAGANWNKSTIGHLQNTIISAAKRTTGEGKDPGRFNYLVQLTDAMAKLMPKVFRCKRQDGAVTTERLPIAELMKLRDAGQFRLWANLHGEQPGECLEFVPMGLFASNGDLTYLGTDVQHFVHTNRYKRIQVIDDKFIVDQRMFVLAVPGYDKVDTKPCPDNEDIEIHENKLQVRLSRQPLIHSNGEKWEDGCSQSYTVERKLLTFDLEMKSWTNTEITQKDGLLTILIHGNKRRPRNR